MGKMGLVTLEEAPAFVREARAEFAARDVQIIDLNAWLDEIGHPAVSVKGSAQLLNRSQVASIDTSAVYVMAGLTFDENGREVYGYRLVLETIEQASGTFDPDRHMSVRPALIFVPGRSGVGGQLMVRGAQFAPASSEVDLTDVHVNVSRRAGTVSYFWNSVAATDVSRILRIVTGCLRAHGLIAPATLALLDMDPDDLRAQRRAARYSAAAAAPPEAPVSVPAERDPFAP